MGVLRGQIDYTDDHGRYTEYYHLVKVLAEGPKEGSKKCRTLALFLRGKCAGERR